MLNPFPTQKHPVKLDSHLREPFTLNPDARSKLLHFISLYGNAVIDNPTRCQALLRDHFENRHYDEERALLLILRLGFLARLRFNTPHTDKAALWLTRSQSLTADLILLQPPPPLTHYDILWALDSWALALNILTPDQLPARAPIAPPAPMPPPPAPPTFSFSPKSPLIWQQPTSSAPASSTPSSIPYPQTTSPSQSPPAPAAKKPFWPEPARLAVLLLLFVGFHLDILKQCTTTPVPKIPQVANPNARPNDYIPPPSVAQSLSTPPPAQPLPPDDKPLPSKTNSIGLTLVLIPAGNFIMGTPQGQPERLNEGFAQNARVEQPFWIGATEVTRAQWLAVMGALPPNLPDESGSDALPVECVSGIEAMDFCRKLSQMEHVTYDLPNETMWEYACRAGARGRFNWGTVPEPQKYANFASSGSLPVASFPPNDWGLYDMHGNVAEWCRDSLPAPTFMNLRGGSWRFPLTQARASFFDQRRSDTKEPGIGFRVVQPYTPPPATTPPQ